MSDSKVPVVGTLTKYTIGLIVYKVINGYSQILPFTIEDLETWDKADKQLYLTWVEKIFKSIKTWSMPQLGEITLLDISDL